MRGSFSLLSDGHARREKVNSRAAVNWTEPDRCRWQRKGGRLSEETRRVASGAKLRADVSDRWCRQFEPDRSSQKEPCTKRCVVLFLYSLTDTTEGRRLTAARLFTGQSPTAAGGRGREGDCRKKHGGLQAERSKSPMFLTDGVVSSSLTGAAI